MADETVNEEIVVDEDASTELALSGVTNVAGIVKSLNDSAAGYSSIPKGDFQQNRKVAAAMLASEPIDENLGKKLSVLDVTVTVVQVRNDATGEIDEAPRVVLFTDDGKAYHAISVGLLTSIRNIFATVGEPENWVVNGKRVPLDITIKKAGTGTRKYFTVELV